MFGYVGLCLFYCRVHHSLQVLLRVGQITRGGATQWLGGAVAPAKFFFLSIRLWRKNKWAPPTLDSQPPYPFLNYSPSLGKRLRGPGPQKKKKIQQVKFSQKKKRKGLGPLEILAPAPLPKIMNPPFPQPIIQPAQSRAHDPCKSKKKKLSSQQSKTKRRKQKTKEKKEKKKERKVRSKSCELARRRQRQRQRVQRSILIRFRGPCRCRCDRERENAKPSFEQDPRHHARRDPLAAAAVGCRCSIYLASPASSLHSSQVFTLIFSFKTL